MLENEFSIIDFYSEIEKRYNNRDEDISLKSGFDDLDCIVFGSLEKGNIVTIGGRPAMGKTIFICSLINNLLEQNKNIAVFSLEESRYRFMTSLLANKGNLNTTRILLGHLQAIDWQKLADAMNFYGDKNLYLSNKCNLTIEEIEEQVKEIKPEFVFIDDIHLVRSSLFPNMTQPTDYVVKEIKRIAQENGVIIFVTSQISRKVERRKNYYPKLIDLKYSSELENLSDIVIMLHREDYYNYEEPSNHKLQLLIKKNKFGPTANIYLFFNYPIIKNIREKGI